ncbi:MAG: hypothetical protein EA384_12240 [Spirochaetaceae bacterium]|nr:MAG: hypothetical protein EA384_12240 [Spirochaetaceae bacterium]
MPDKVAEQGYPAARIVCSVHHGIAADVYALLRTLNVRSALLQGGRTIRQFARRRPFGLPGSVVRLEDSPVDQFTFSVAREEAIAVLEMIVAAADLGTPGRGTAYAQDVVEYSCEPSPLIAGTDPDLERYDRSDTRPMLLYDLSHVTVITSNPGGGEQLGRIALELGTCVPVVTRGKGTGIRDRLGLLRITIPADKEIVAFLVPSYDAGSIIRLLTEEARLDRPGSGFVYETHVRAARIDTRLRIGLQEYAASLEQIIAAIDELKSGTAWRKRFSAMEYGEQVEYPGLRRDNRELTVVCTEGRTRSLVDAAIAAGAGGATTSRVRRLALAETDDAAAAVEYSVINVPAKDRDSVIEALRQSIAFESDASAVIQMTESPLASSHRS